MYILVEILLELLIGHQSEIPKFDITLNRWVSLTVEYHDALIKGPGS